MTDQELLKGSWNTRYKEMVVMMDTEQGRARVVSLLNALKETKDLSFGERKMLDHAMNWEKYIKKENEKVINIKSKIRVV